MLTRAPPKGYVVPLGETAQENCFAVICMGSSQYQLCPHYLFHMKSMWFITAIGNLSMIYSNHSNAICLRQIMDRCIFNSVCFKVI
jgi:hypothetical protein